MSEVKYIYMRDNLTVDVREIAAVMNANGTITIHLKSGNTMLMHSDPEGKKYVADYAEIIAMMRDLNEPKAEPDAISILAEITDTDECDYDHNGLCQAHHLHPKPCPHERAKKLLHERKDVAK